MILNLKREIYLMGNGHLFTKTFKGTAATRSWRWLCISVTGIFQVWVFVVVICKNTPKVYYTFLEILKYLLRKMWLTITQTLLLCESILFFSSQHKIKKETKLNLGKPINQSHCCKLKCLEVERKYFLLICEFADMSRNKIHFKSCLLKFCPFFLPVDWYRQSEAGESDPRA